MQKNIKVVLTMLAACLSMGSVACSLDIEQTLAIDEGSAFEIEVPAGSGNVSTAALEGAAVMNIDIFISYFDFLFGDYEGDVTVGEILFASDGFTLLGIPTEELCVIPDPVDPGGGTFEANLYKGEATFDVQINTRALVGNPILSGAIPDGFAFPFNLQSTLPLSLTDMLGLLTGAGGLTVSQDIDETLDVTVGLATVPIHLGGTIALASTDAFPTSPLIDTCLALTAP
jgi:hypothetical protein